MQIGSFSDFHDTHGLDICYPCGDAYESNLFKPPHLDHARSDLVVLAACRAVEMHLESEEPYDGEIRRVATFTWHAPVKTNLEFRISKTPLTTGDNSMVTGSFETQYGRIYLYGTPAGTQLKEEKFVFFPAGLAPISLDNLTFKVQIGEDWIRATEESTAYATAAAVRSSMLAAKTNTFMVEKCSVIRRVMDIVPRGYSPTVTILSIDRRVARGNVFRRARVRMGECLLTSDIVTPESQEIEAVLRRGEPLRTPPSEATAPLGGS